MPQIFLVVKCIECSAFQATQEKKRSVFKCAICGTQQASQRIFAKGSGKNCREVVQQYNAARAFVEEEDVLAGEEGVDAGLSQHGDDGDDFERNVAADKWRDFAENDDDVRFAEEKHEIPRLFVCLPTNAFYFLTG